MRVAIFGSSVDSIVDHTDMNETQVHKLMEDIAQFLVDEGHEILIIPDKGIAYDLAKEYKTKGGKKVWGMIPSMDTRFGIQHIKPFVDILDERVVQENWYTVDGEVAAANDAAIVLGMDAKTLIRVSFLNYHYKSMGCETALIWFQNTISQIPEELDKDLTIVWLESMETLSKVIKPEEKEEDEFLV